MRILELSLRNYRVFEELDLELPARVIGIFGPNGSGKSTLMEAIQFACYGRARTDKAQIRSAGVLVDCEVRLVFEHAGRQYEVRRAIRGKNHQTEAELFVGGMQLASGVSEVDAEIERLLHMDLPVFRASVFAEQKQLDAFSEVTKGKRKEMVLRLLGIRPVDEARTAARKEAREAKQRADDLAARLPDLSEQEAELAGLREEATEAEAEASRAASALSEANERVRAADGAFAASDAVRQEVERLQVELRAIEAAAAAAQDRREELARRIERLEAALSEREDLELEHAAVADAPQRLSAGHRVVDLAAEIHDLDARLEKLEALDPGAILAELEALEARRQERRQEAALARSAHEAARQALVTAEEALERASEADPAHPCPTCGRPLGDDFAEYVAHCQRAVDGAASALKDAARRMRETAAAADEAERLGRDAAARAKTATQAVAERTAAAERREQVRVRFEEIAEPFDGATPDLDELETAARRASEIGTRLAKLEAEADRLAETRTDLMTCDTEIEVARTRGEDVGAELARLAFDPEEHARLEKERAEAARLVEEARTHERRAADALNEARSRARELEATIEKVKEIASRVRELRDEARVIDRVGALLEGFRSFLYGRIMPQLSRDAEALFRDLTNHEYEDLRIDEDTLAIEIADGGRYFPIERFSGSEVDLANLALRVAISTHLSRMAGADVGVMVLDEVMGALDAERKDLFVQTIGKLSRRFHQLFVITHAEQVKDQFPASIEVRKLGRRRSIAALV